MVVAETDSEHIHYHIHYHITQDITSDQASHNLHGLKETAKIPRDEFKPTFGLRAKCMTGL